MDLDLTDEFVRHPRDCWLGDPDTYRIPLYVRSNHITSIGNTYLGICGTHPDEALRARQQCYAYTDLMVHRLRLCV